MLSSVLKFFQQELTVYFKTIGPVAPNVEFPQPGDNNQESILFKKEALTLLLTNLEEEAGRIQRNMLRDPKSDQPVAALPEFRLNLYLLFVANFSDYLESMDKLSLVIRYFQSHRKFDHQNYPSMPSDLEGLIIELLPLPFAGQNEVWNTLRTSYKPSVLYKVHMVAPGHQEPLAIAGVTFGNV